MDDEAGLEFSEQGQEMVGEQSQLKTVIDMSMHALSDNLKRKTITLTGFIGDKALNILVDTGSTDSYINYQWVETLKLQTHETLPFMVTIADGSSFTGKTVF